MTVASDGWYEIWLPTQLLLTPATVAVIAISPWPVAVRVLPNMVAKPLPERIDQVTGCPVMLKGLPY